ncbi:MAG: hypothetical protein ACFB4J_00510 [Elainellaceae cyanobacterium]
MLDSTLKFAGLPLAIALAVVTTACAPEPSAPESSAPELSEPELSEPASQEEPVSPETAESPETKAQPAESPESEVATAATSGTPTVGDFSTDELFAAGGGGCGMSLWKAGDDPREGGFIFFNGLDGTALMRIDGEMVSLTRDQTTGEEFYGQFTSQTFIAPDDSLSATTNVVLGEPGEIESVAIPSGTLILQAGNAVTEIPVVGDAGC